jgi:iron(III) transport system ATP-binding protein
VSALELRDVSKTFGRRVVIQGVSLSIGQGERVAVLGPSGCGKTTLLRLVAGLEVPDTGSIGIDDRLVAERGRNIFEPEARNLSMVFQDVALWPHMTVEQHLEFTLRYRTAYSSVQRSSRALEVLDMVRLTGRRGARPGELSGGEQQRVALARALVANPKLLLMDEPLSSVDPKLNLHLRQELLRFHAHLGFTLMYVTHDFEEAEALASRIVTMEGGELTA